MTTNLMMNYWNGEWHRPAGSELLAVLNPATQEVLAEVPLSRADAVAQAAEAAQAALLGWRRMPPNDRAQYLYHMKRLLEEHRDELARLGANCSLCSTRLPRRCWAKCPSPELTRWRRRLRQPRLPFPAGGGCRPTTAPSTSTT